MRSSWAAGADQGGTGGKYFRAGPAGNADVAERIFNDQHVSEKGWMMARFQRITWDDLGNFTRSELLRRVEAEQQYWARKEEHGLSEADQEARREFNKILCAVVNPPGLGDAMGEMAARLKSERATNTSSWNENPGRQSP